LTRFGSASVPRGRHGKKRSSCCSQSSALHVPYCTILFQLLFHLADEKGRSYWTELYEISPGWSSSVRPCMSFLLQLRSALRDLMHFHSAAACRSDLPDVTIGKGLMQPCSFYRSILTLPYPTPGPSIPSPSFPDEPGVNPSGTVPRLTTQRIQYSRSSYPGFILASLLASQLTLVASRFCLPPVHLQLSLLLLVYGLTSRVLL